MSPEIYERLVEQHPSRLLKAGTRVKITNTDDLCFEVVGRSGVIRPGLMITADDDDYVVYNMCMEFDGTPPIAAHSCNRTLSSSRGWWVSMDEIVWDAMGELRKRVGQLWSEAL